MSTPSPEPARRRARRRAVTLAILAPLLVGGCENVRLDELLPAREDDAPLSREVGAALDANPEVGRFSIAVKSLDEDTVRLSGRVDTAAQKATAERVAAQVPGVRSVVNTLFLRD